MTSDPQVITENIRLTARILYFSLGDLTSFLSSKTKLSTVLGSLSVYLLSILANWIWPFSPRSTPDMKYFVYLKSILVLSRSVSTFLK